MVKAIITTVALAHHSVMSSSASSDNTMVAVLAVFTMAVISLGFVLED